MRCDDLRRELTEDAGEDDHTESDVKEDELNNFGHVEDVDRGVQRLTTLVDNEDDQEDHELTAHEIPIEVVAPEGQGAVLVGDGVTILV